MDLHETIKAWASPLIAAGALLYTVLTGRGKAAKDEQTRLESRIAAVETGQAEVRAQFARMELKVEHLPTREQFHRIELNFADMSGNMKVVTAALGRVEKLLGGKEL